MMCDTTMLSQSICPCHQVFLHLNILSLNFLPFGTVIHLTVITLPTTSFSVFSSMSVSRTLGNRR